MSIAALALPFEGVVELDVAVAVDVVTEVEVAAVEVVVVGELLELHAAVVMPRTTTLSIAAMPRRSRPGRPEKGGRLMGPNCRHEAVCRRPLDSPG